MKSLFFSEFCRWAVVSIFALLILLSESGAAPSFESDWSGNRIWIGPEYWANPLQDWELSGNEVIGLAAANRTLHQLTHQVSSQSGQLRMSVDVRLEDGINKGAKSVGGFRFGIKGDLEGYRHALVLPTSWLEAGVHEDGRVTLEKKVSSSKLDPNEWIHLQLSAELDGERATIELIASQESTGKRVRLRTSVPVEDIQGNLALLSGGAQAKPDRGKAAKWHFRDWEMEGTALSSRPDQVFGPILWTQYTLSDEIVKLLVMMAPVEGSNAPVRLEMKEDGKWVQQSSQRIDQLSRTACFRLEDWDSSRNVDYRIACHWEGHDYSWEGRIRAEPVNQSSVSMAAFSCDNGYTFPNTTMVRNVGIQDPDILYFAGDQIYESHGGFGITRHPVDIAMLEYLRKYWMFGWTWRDLLKDRPSIIIPDDHDVFQGNIWGHGGRRIPDMGEKLTGQDWLKGGYGMDPDWVNAVERTQTGSLPDPVDPRPVEQGIGTYFTRMQYGGLDLAIIEDRKFKTGPKDPAKDEPQLLGPRQEAFLETWMQDKDDDIKVFLSQTIFCKVTTHAGKALKFSENGTDSNGWPKNKRDKALRILSSEDVIMVHGDQHLGALVHQGVDAWEDGPIAFMVPGAPNGFPRAWWPEEKGLDQKPGEPSWTGRYMDSLGNRMTVLAAANPEKGSNLLSKAEVDPETIAHRKGSGHGVIRFDRDTREVTFEMWRFQFDAIQPKPEDQFTGFPKTIHLNQ